MLANNSSLIIGLTEKPALWFHWFSPSLRLRLGPQSHLLQHGLLSPRFHLGPTSLCLQLGPPGLRCHPRVPSFWLSLGLHHSWLHLVGQGLSSTLALSSIGSNVGLCTGCALGFLWFLINILFVPMVTDYVLLP